MIKMLKTMTLMTMIAASGAAVASAGAEIGKPAPDFTLADSSGTTISLSDYRGKVVVLEWTNPDCPFVKRHNTEGSMKKLTSAYDDGVVFLTINSTNYMDREANADYVEKESISWPVLVDQDGAVGHAYGAKTTPHMYIIDAEGTLVYNGAIDSDPRGSEDAADRTNYVAEALDDVLAGKAVSTPETTPYGCSVKYKK